MEAATEVCADGWRQIFQKNFSKPAATRDKGKRIEKGKVASAVTPMVEMADQIRGLQFQSQSLVRMLTATLIVTLN